MSYLTTGKRSILEAQHNTTVQQWAKKMSIPAPFVKIHAGRNGSGYRARDHRIGVVPGVSQDSLVHEFAHHVNRIVYGQNGHGPTFRIALVETAAIAYGRASAYNWGREYSNIRSWARKHGLLK